MARSNPMRWLASVWSDSASAADYTASAAPMLPE
jgi:hypothetical protein